MVHRRPLDRLWSLVYPSLRWSCDGCHWTGLLPSHRVAQKHRSLLQKVFSGLYILLLVAALGLCFWLLLGWLGGLISSVFH